MISNLVRALKRFAVLIPGLIIAYISIRDIFPLLDKRVPVALAIFLTYVIGAYVLIPALIRLIRAAAPARHLQAYSVTPDGFASDPVNVGIIGTREELIKSMQAAGWFLADSHNPKYLARAIFSTLFRRSYPTAPMSSLYLFGRKQDLGFEIPIEGGIGRRHHVRFWATDYTGGGFDFGTIEWHKSKLRRRNAGTLWVGAASRDVGITFIRHNVQVSHMIDPDTDSERELIEEGLRKARRVESQKTIQLAKPYKLTNRVWRGYLNTDGKLEIIKLKKK